MVPNMVLRPRLSSMRKNSVDQKGLAGKRAITSVKAMNARPVPSTPCSHTRTEGKDRDKVCNWTSTQGFFSSFFLAVHVVFFTPT